MKSRRRFILFVLVLTFLVVARAQPQELLLKDRQLIITLGNSITEQGENPDGYVSMMRKTLATLYPEQIFYIVNVGISGHKATDMAQRFERDVLQYQPDWVTISVGVNDVWHDFLAKERNRPELQGVPLPLFQLKLIAMVKRAQSQGIRVALFTTTVIKENLASPENKKLVEYNKAIRKIARDCNCLLIDMDQAFRTALDKFQSPGMSDRGILTNDGVHMLPSGNWLMAETALKAFGIPEQRICLAKPLVENLIAEEKEANECRLARYEEGNFEAGSPRENEKRVVFFGSSSVDGWNLADDFPTIPFLNRGIGGETSRQMVLRFRQDVLNLKPYAAIIFLGSCNDFWEHNRMPTAETKSNLIKLARMADRNGVKLALGAVSPVNDYLAGKDFIASHPVATVRELNAWLKNFCETNNYVFVDFYSAVADSNGKLAPEFTVDGMHGNAEGYARWKPLVVDALKKLEAWQE